MLSCSKMGGVTNQGFLDMTYKHGEKSCTRCYSGFNYGFFLSFLPRVMIPVDFEMLEVEISQDWWPWCKSQITFPFQFPSESRWPEGRLKYTLLWKLKVLGLGVYRFALKEGFCVFCQGKRRHKAKRYDERRCLVHPRAAQCPGDVWNLQSPSPWTKIDI